MSVHVTLRIFSGLPGSSLNEYACNNRASEQKCESNMADSQTQKSNFTRSQAHPPLHHCRPPLSICYHETYCYTVSCVLQLRVNYLEVVVNFIGCIVYLWLMFTSLSLCNLCGVICQVLCIFVLLYILVLWINAYFHFSRSSIIVFLRNAQSYSWSNFKIPSSIHKSNRKENLLCNQKYLWATFQGHL